jgi:hypothetical protein
MALPWRLRSRRGSLLLEAIVSIGIFALFLAGIGVSLVLGERSTMAGGDRVRAGFVAEQSLEAVRQMRNVSFSSLTAGTYGVKLVNNAWALTGSSVVSTDGYRSNVTITNQSADWKQVAATVTWNFGQTRSGSLTLQTYVTNWRKPYTIGNWASPSLQSTVSQSGSPSFQKVVVSGNYAYVSASAGNGLYVYDISNLSSPVRVSSSLSIGSPVYGLAISGTGLLLATGSATQEVQLFDIESPTTLTSANLIGTYNLPGSGRARSVALYGDTAYIGATEDPGNPEFFSLAISGTGALSYLDSLTTTGSVLAISLSDGYAYIADAKNSGEFLVVDIFDPAELVYAPGVGMDLDSTEDGIAMSTFGTSALLGRISGTSISEVVLYVIGESPVPTPPPGPWTQEIAGDANDIASVYGGKYAFIGSSGDPNELRVLDVPKFSSGQAPTVATYNATATIRGLAYDWHFDRLFAVTSSTFLIFRPG